jgi:hypothetical protein
MYFDTEKKSRAEKELRALKQMKTMAAYTQALMIHAHNCGWEQQTLVSQYTQGLHKDVQLALVLARTTFDKLSDVSHLALKIDNKIHGADANPIAPTPTADPNTMDILAVNAWMSDADRTWMMRQGLCFWCEEHGHLAWDFPLKGTSKGGENGKGKAKVRIDALEEELKKLTESMRKEGRAANSKNGDAQA